MPTKLSHRHCMRWRQSIYGKEHASKQATMDALAITHRLLRGYFELRIRITLGIFPLRS